MSRRAHGLRWATIWIGLASGCGPQLPPRATLERWIAEPPVEQLAASDLRTVDCARHWTFPDGKPGGDLRLVEGSQLGGPGSGLTVRGGLIPPRFVFEGTFSREQVELAELVVSGVRRGRVRLLVAPAEGGPAEEVAIEAGTGTGPQRNRFLLDTTSSQIPAGPLRLTLEPTSIAGEIVTVESICVGRTASLSARVEALAKRSWIVTVDDEAREALLFPLSLRISHETSSAAAGRFRFGLARLVGTSGAVRLEVSSDAGGGSRSRLLARTVTEEELARGWVDLTLALETGRTAHRTIEIALEPEVESANGAYVLSAPTVRYQGAAPKRPNIVLVSVDTLRADHLSLYGYPRATSPRLSAWADGRAFVFLHTVAPAPWTLPSHTSLFSGLEALRHGANYHRGASLAPLQNSLAVDLRRGGYQTVAISGGGFVHPSYGLGRGFERFRVWGRGLHADEELEEHLGRVRRFLEQEAEPPFFLFLHTYEVHNPNGARQPYFSRFSRLPADEVFDLAQDVPDAANGFQTSLHAVVRKAGTGEKGRPIPSELAEYPVDAYDSAIAYVDERLGDLFAWLERSPLAPDTIVAVVSDHGETLAPSGAAGHGYASIDNLLVPMILAVPHRVAEPRRVSEQVRLHDLYPTLIELAGLPPPDGIDAASLLPVMKGEERGGRDAFSYAASTNQGIVRIAADGLKLQWLNSPWRPIAAERRWFDVAGFTETARAAPAAEVDRRATGELVRRYAASVTGLQVRLSTEGSVPVEVELVSDLVDPVSTKLLSPISSGLGWVDIGTLRATVEPGQALELVFERAPRPRLGIRISARSAGCGGAGESEIEAESKPGGAGSVWRVTPTGCSEPGAAPTLTARVRWSGEQRSGELAAADEALRRDLEALGYLH